MHLSTDESKLPPMQGGVGPAASLSVDAECSAAALSRLSLTQRNSPPAPPVSEPLGNEAAGGGWSEELPSQTQPSLDCVPRYDECLPAGVQIVRSRVHADKGSKPSKNDLLVAKMGGTADVDALEVTSVSIEWLEGDAAAR